jgi:ribosomal protein L5
MNRMQQVRLEKITLNIGAGKDQKKLELGLKLLKKITEIDPVRTVTNKRIPTWGLRPGLPIG